VVFLLLLLFVVAAQQGVGNRWAEANARAAWARLLPAQDYEGYFTTAQARYLFGEQEGQFVAVSGGGVCETLPPRDHAAEIVAVHLAQKPDAAKILVFGGNSLGLATLFRSLPQVQHVTWLHPDPSYPKKLLAVLEAHQAAIYAKLSPLPEVPGIDIRAFAQQQQTRYDLIVINLPDITNLVLNRYCTAEFFQLLKGVLNPEGVVSVRISGGENFLGDELKHLGASMLATTESAFKHVVLKPGDETWMIASDGDGLTQSPPTLQERFAKIEGAAKVYPPEAVPALYPQDRVEFQMQAYRAALKAGGDLLLNTDARPKALLFSLLLAIRQAGWPSAIEQALVFTQVGLWILIVPILLYGLLRFIYLVKGFRRNGHYGRNGRHKYDSRFLVFSMGFTGMALPIALMFSYQARFGSLFFDIGLITAVFMLGSFFGSLASNRLLRLQPILLGVAVLVIIHCGFLFGLRESSGEMSRYGYGICFALGGLFTGAYFPIAAHGLKAAGYGAAASGSSLEMYDHIGGAAGSLVTGLILLPFFGGAGAFTMLVFLVAANLAPLMARRAAGETQDSEYGPGFPLSRERRDGFDRFVRPAGYIMTGIAACFLIGSNFVAHENAARRALSESIYLRDAARYMTGAEATEETKHLVGDAVLVYFTTPDTPEKPGGYVFSSDRWGSRIAGYAGPISLAIYAGKDGVLRGYTVLRSMETPQYLYMAESQKDRLFGTNIFAPDPFAGLDATSGATCTGKALFKIIEASGRGFATEVLGREAAAAAEQSASLGSLIRDRQFQEAALLAILALLAVGFRYRPRVWPRRVLLLIAVLAAGWAFNLQYSTNQVMALLSLNIGNAGLNAPFFLLVAVPVIVILFGNLYCGYLCPFGALQEWISDFLPASMNLDPDKTVWRYGRAVKYVLLFLIVLAFSFTRDFAILNADPLATFFSFASSGRVMLVFGAALLVLSVFFRRFWCRNLCPAGAFLSLLSGLALLRRVLPPRFPGRCDMGVRSPNDLDCLYCDRCATPGRVRSLESVVCSKTSPYRLQTQDFRLLIAVASAAIIFLFLTGIDVKSNIAARLAPAQSQALPTAAGKPRNVDLERVKNLIQQQYLSDHEADFYNPAPKAAPIPGPPPPSVAP